MPLVSPRLADPALAAAKAALSVGGRIAFCGPIAEPGCPAGGGYEAANRRTCDALVRRGQQVIELRYPHPARSRWRKLAGYASSFVRNAWWLLRRRADYDLLHLTPLNMHFALAETVLVSCARLAGKPVLVDVRAGTFVRHYEAGSALYRHTIDRTLRLATQVAVEGPDYVAFVRRRTHRPVLHFPNYVDAPSLQRELPARRLAAGDTLRLVCFGRLVPEKGIETALQALGLLIDRGRPVTLDLIGDGPPDYVARLRAQHAGLPVTWQAGMPMHALLERAARAHVFVFPSRHDGEGHSNALNEAMALGLVPVCSAQGFSRGVVGNAGIVLPVAATAADYADALDGLCAADRWTRLSARAAARVRALYSEDATLPALLDTYRRMLLTR